MADMFITATVNVTLFWVDLVFFDDRGESRVGVLRSGRDKLKKYVNKASG